MTEYHIIKIDETNWRKIAALKVSSMQTAYIESNATSLLEAAYNKKMGWSPYALYHEETLIGFAMIGAFRPSERYIWLDRFMIDRRFQGLGHSKPLLQEIILYIKNNWEVDEIVLSLELDNKVALNIYEQIGFTLNGMTDESNDEKLMVYTLEDRNNN